MTTKVMIAPSVSFSYMSMIGPLADEHVADLDRAGGTANSCSPCSTSAPLANSSPMSVCIGLTPPVGSGGCSSANAPQCCIANENVGGAGIESNPAALAASGSW